MRCVNHPALPETVVIGGTPYCAKCEAGMKSAVGKLDPHVSPTQCFVWYTGGAKGWEPIEGTGCAHFVSHELGIKHGRSGERCLAGYTFRVATMLGGRSKVHGGLRAVKPRDIWVNAARTHCGIVTAIGPDVVSGPGGDDRAIWIRHSSSRLHKVSLDRYDKYFESKGEFYR